MPKLRKKKNPFADLPLEFKDSIVGMSSDQIRMKIAEVALDQQEMQKAKSLDQDLFEKKESLKYANEPYRDGAKVNNLKIKFCKQVLEDQGKA